MRGLIQKRTDILLGIAERAPLGSGQDALARRLRLISKDLDDPVGIRANPLEEHEICAQWFLRRVRIFQIRTTRLAGLALRSAECILGADVVGRKHALPGGKLALVLFLGKAGFALEDL